MKKNILLSLICLFSASVCLALEYIDRSQDYYTGMDKKGVVFLQKFQTCSPAKYNDEILYGKTKDGKCHYSYKEEDEVVHCYMPMQVAIGYSTTAQDVIDFAEEYASIADERLNQNNEIRNLMLDYCKIN